MRPARCAAIINAPSARGSCGVGSDVSDSACQMSSVVKSKVLVAICLMMSIVSAAQVGLVLVATCAIALSRVSVAAVIVSIRGLMPARLTANGLLRLLVLCRRRRKV